MHKIQRYEKNDIYPKLDKIVRDVKKEETRNWARKLRDDLWAFCKLIKLCINVRNIVWLYISMQQMISFFTRGFELPFGKLYQKLSSRSIRLMLKLGSTRILSSWRRQLLRLSQLLWLLYRIYFQSKTQQFISSWDHCSSSCSTTCSSSQKKFYFRDQMLIELLENLQRKDCEYPHNLGYHSDRRS